MIRPRGNGLRAGITLTEILISILIMGVGMLSLATLFPLGLARLRDAARYSRSSHLIQTAGQEIASRDLLFKPSFRFNAYPFDPFTQDPATTDTLTSGEFPSLGITKGLDRLSKNAGYTGLAFGAGLPVCYDPMWWYEVNQASGLSPSTTPGIDFRFGSGIGLLRQDGSADPSAHGLQRITNFPFSINPAGVFGSPDDLVMQSDGSQARNPDGTANNSSGQGSPIVPDLSTGSKMYDYSYTWLFTGKQTDVTNGSVFDGDVVIFHNRPFGTEQINPTSDSKQTGTINRAAGETVVEAVWGYGAQNASVYPYSLNDRTVQLRWHNSQPDPDVRIGGWIADVTYERNNSTELSRWYPTTWTANYPAQRCYWYRVAKKSEVTDDPDTTLTGYRQMVVTVSSPLRAKTPLQDGSNLPLHVNAAFVSPYVVNVVSRIFYTR